MNGNKVKKEKTVEVVEEVAQQEEKKVEVVDKAPQQEKAKKPVWKIVLNILSYVFLGLLLLFDGFALYSKLSMKGTNGAMSFFGTEVRIVLTGSMVGTDEFYASHPEFKIGRIDIHDAVFVKTAPAGDADQKTIDSFYSGIEVGDVLTFIDQTHNGKVVSHRIVSLSKLVDQETGKTIYFYNLLGDHPEAQDDPQQRVQSDSGLILGKVTGTNRALGNFLYTLVGNKLIIIFLVIVPCGLFAIYEIVKIIIVVKKAHTQEALGTKTQEISMKDEELERLRKELEEIKKEKEKSKEEK